MNSQFDKGHYLAVFAGCIVSFFLAIKEINSSCFFLCKSYCCFLKYYFFSAYFLSSYLSNFYDFLIKLFSVWTFYFYEFYLISFVIYL